MRALLFSQILGISYKVTHNPLSQFLSAHDLHNGTNKCLGRHHHLVQLLLGIQVKVTLHQRYIRVHLEGLISGVCLLQLLSHQYHIFRCKPLDLYTHIHHGGQ